MSTEQTGTLKSNVSSDSNLLVRVRTSPSLTASYVSVKPGTRVTVLPDTPVKDTSGFTWYKVKYDQAANKVGWVRNDVIKLDAAPSPPNPTQPSSQPKYKLTVTASTTWFKQSPVDSSQLQDDAKHSVPKNSVVLISAYQENPPQDPNNNHFYVTLADPLQIGKFNSWYVYKPDVAITLNK
ncbi:MAG: hypothetical protein ABI417_22070 [Coleofasciculaceae cyanobacterium]